MMSGVGSTPLKTRGTKVTADFQINVFVNMKLLRHRVLLLVSSNKKGKYQYATVSLPKLW
jgi:hypothetical protein